MNDVATSSVALTEHQRAVLTAMSEGEHIAWTRGKYTWVWYLMSSRENVPETTVRNLRKAKLITAVADGVWIISAAGRAALEAANGVQNLTANVASYEVEVADLFMPELDNVEWIEVGSTVYVKPDFGRKAFYAKVEEVDVETQRAKVWHIPGGYFAGEWGLDDLELVEAANQIAAPF